MSERADDAAEARRLERLWAGEFGDAYIERNSELEGRGRFWTSVLDRAGGGSVLEVGCNIGANLRWFTDASDPWDAFGIDVNHNALRRMRTTWPKIGAVRGLARALPFRTEAFDLVVTIGVLIHQPESTLPHVMSEMVRCSRRWLLCGEYYAPETEEVRYRDQRGALFRRDYGGIFARDFADLRLRDSGFLGLEDAFDDTTWYLFERDRTA